MAGSRELKFRIRLEMYPRHIRGVSVSDVSDTDTPPPRSIHVIEMLVLHCPNVCGLNSLLEFQAFLELIIN